MSEIVHAVLVHNVGHHDVYPILHGEDQIRKIRGFAHFSFGKDVLAQIESVHPEITSVQGALHFQPAVPMSWTAKKLRRRLVDRKGGGSSLSEAAIDTLCFPLIESAISAVYEHLNGKTLSLHVVLVSSGASDDEDSDGSQGDSTACVARLQEKYLTQQHPDLTVHCVHRHADNAFTFANSADLLMELEGVIQSARKPSVDNYGEDWPKHFGVFLSANTGTISDIAAMLEGLRTHHPSLVHIPAAHKWPADDDHAWLIPNATILANDELRQRPARAAETIEDLTLQFAIHEMVKWRAYFTEHRPKRAHLKHDNEEYVYWFRKGKKEVLAVVVTEDETTGELSAHRGVNLEVSLPTGTLCAERNAIGSALAKFPNIERKNVKAVAVLSLAESIGPTLGPCGACTEWLRKVAEVNPDFRVITFDDYACTRVFIDPVD